MLEFIEPIIDLLGSIASAIGDILSFLQITASKPKKKKIPDDPTNILFKDSGRGGVIIPPWA